MKSMRPKPRRYLSTALLLVAATTVCLVALLSSAAESFSLALLAELFMGVGTLACVAAVLYLEDKRMRSVELDHDGLRALVWKKAAGFLPYRFETTEMRWDEIREVAQAGFVVGLKGPQGEILVNSYLFEQPEEVLSFINMHVTVRK